MLNLRALAPSLVLPLALGAALAASPALAAAPEAADKTPGMALMSAIVDIDGNLIGGSGATGAIKTGTGNYHVTFARSVAGCMYLPAASNSTYGTPETGVITSASSIFADKTKVHVNTQGTSASNFNAAFMLMVFCAQ